LYLNIYFEVSVYKLSLLSSCSDDGFVFDLTEKWRSIMLHDG